MREERIQINSHVESQLTWFDSYFVFFWRFSFSLCGLWIVANLLCKAMSPSLNCKEASRWSRNYWELLAREWGFEGEGFEHLWMSIYIICTIYIYIILCYIYIYIILYIYIMYIIYIYIIYILYIYIIYIIYIYQSKVKLFVSTLFFVSKTASISEECAGVAGMVWDSAVAQWTSSGTVTGEL